MRIANILKCTVIAFALITTAAACEVVSERQTAGEYVDDATITAKVKTSLISDLGLKQISVETMQNVVQLSGFVETQEIKNQAGAIARSISGVRDVQNDLIVQ